MKRFSRCVCLLLVMVMFFSTSVFALDTGNTKSSSFFAWSSVYLHETGDRTFEAWFEVTAMRSMDELGASYIKIQRSSDGENWTTMKTVNKSPYNDLVGEDAVTWAGCITYTGTVGYYYRAKIELYAKDSTGTGYMTEYTSEMKLT